MRGSWDASLIKLNRSKSLIVDVTTSCLRIGEVNRAQNVARLTDDTSELSSL